MISEGAGAPLHDHGSADEQCVMDETGAGSVPRCRSDWAGDSPRIETARPGIIGLDASARRRFGEERTALREQMERSMRLPEDRGRGRCTLGTCGK